MGVMISSYCEKCKQVSDFEEIHEPSFTLLYRKSCGSSRVQRKTLQETQSELARLTQSLRALAGKEETDERS